MSEDMVAYGQYAKRVDAGVGGIQVQACRFHLGAQDAHFAPSFERGRIDVVENIA